LSDLPRTAGSNLMSLAPPLIRVRDLCVHLQGQAILHDINLEIGEREIITLIGPNGAGKTTLIRTLLGLQRPTGGRLERRPGLRIGYMPQKLHVDPTFPLTVERFLRLTLKASRRFGEVLELTGTAHLRRRPVQS